MEKTELELITELSARNPEIKILWEEHQLYEKQLEKLEKKAVRSPEDNRVVTELKKKKLLGKTKLDKLLERHRSEE